MRLTQVNITIASLFRTLLFVFFFTSISIYASEENIVSIEDIDSKIDSLFYSAEANFQNERYLMAISEYKK
ncbi:hypothetical protein ACWGOQ_0011275 [Aquimarina sp. M1]